MKSNKFFDDIQKTKFDFVKNFFKFGIVSVAIILVGFIVWLCAGFNLGLDFTGGSIVKIKFGTALEQQGKYEEYVGKIKTVFGNYGISLSQIQQEDSGADACISVRFKDLPNHSEQEMADLISGPITLELTQTLNPDGSITAFKVYEGQRIGSTASSELMLNALLAVIIASVILLIYIAIRFEFASGVATLLGLVHDVLIVLAFVAITRIELNSSFIAAIITVIGYSINNTIIVFDRIRENNKNEKVAAHGNAYVVNLSIKQTLIRSIYTTLTTLVSIIALVILGVDSIKVFLLPIIIGLIAGAYSSILLSAPIWELMIRRLTNRKKIEGEHKRRASKQIATATDASNNEVKVEVVESN